MGKDSRTKELSNVGQTAQGQYNQLYSGPTALESEFTPISQGFQNAYQNALGQQTGDYSNIMKGYQDFTAGLGGPTQFSAQNVSAERPAELTQAYGYLNEAAPGYRTFAETGGYSPTDIQELRARGVSPIRSAYGNTMMEMNRARALGGAGGAPNYIAAASKAQRELPGQMAEATTGVNAKLAEDIRTGKLAGLAGITGIGSTMGGLSSDEASRMLQAAIANQSAGLQAQNLSEQSLQNLRNAQLQGLGGQTSLYGTTPAMAATFGNQALQAYSERNAQEQMRNNLGLGLLSAQNQAYGAETPQKSTLDKILGAASSVLPYTGLGQPTTGQPTYNPMTYGGAAQNPYSSPYVDQNYFAGVGGADYSNPNANLGFTGWAGNQGYYDPYSGQYLPSGAEGMNQGIDWNTLGGGMSDYYDPYSGYPPSGENFGSPWAGTIEGGW